MTRLRPSHRITLLLAMLYLIASPGYASEWTFNAASRVVAISDIHGDFGAMVRTLQSADVVDDQ